MREMGAQNEYWVDQNDRYHTKEFNLIVKYFFFFELNKNYVWN